MLFRRFVPLAVWALFLAGSHAQDAPAFEAASVKVNRTGPAGGDQFVPSPGRLRVVNATLKTMIQAAYHVSPGTLFGLTGWMETDRFDIEAKTPGNADFAEELRMLQSLLAERFQLRFHRETRQVATMVLVLGKNGAKLERSQEQDQAEQVKIQTAAISGTAIPFGHFVSILSTQLRQPIANETGLTGKYDIDLKYALDDGSAVAGRPSIFAALEDLGLKLETRKALVEVMMIDSAAKPGEN